MTLKEIAYRNLLRRKSKAAFVLAGLCIGIATVVAVISLVNAMSDDINHKLEKYGANILIIPKTENLSLTYGGLSLGGVSFAMEEILETDLSRIKSIKNAANVAAVGPMVLGVLPIGQHKVLLAGVDFKTARVLKPWWSVKGELPRRGEVLLGSDTARVLKLDLHAAFNFKGQTLKVSGILRPTGSQDDQLAFTETETAQLILNKPGLVSMAEVAALCKDCPIDDMVRQISEILPKAKVQAIQQVVKGRMETLSHFKKFSYGFSVVIILIGSLVVLVTMMGSVRERTKEIGIFRAIGFRRSHIIQIVFMEALIVSALAGISGYLLGLGVVKIAYRFFTESHSLAIPIDWQLAGGSFLLALTVGLLASAYPALTAARLNPNDALRAL